MTAEAVSKGGVIVTSATMIATKNKLCTTQHTKQPKDAMQNSDNDNTIFECDAEHKKKPTTTPTPNICTGSRLEMVTSA